MSILEHLDVSMMGAVNHATIEHPDPVFPARPSPAIQASLNPLVRTKFRSDEWLPEGFHHGLHIIHRPLESAGPMTGGGPKWVHHITVSSPFQVDLMADVLAAKRAAPQLLIGFRHGVSRPIVYQFMPFSQAGRALEHPAGTPETNRANCIQLEIAANVGDVPHFAEWHFYRAIANLVRMTNDAIGQNVPSTLARSFHNQNRLGADEFIHASGHLGHMHVPHNTHVDPTPPYLGAAITKALHELKAGHFYDLSGVGPK